jgi:hypothetical protein
VSSFQKVATFTIVNGAKQGGNVAAYFCAPDGRVLHCVAGPVDATTMLNEARWVVDNTKKALAESKRTETPFKVIFRRLHAERLRQEHGLVVEPVTFDPAEARDDGPLTYRDPNSDTPLMPVLPTPPIDGPDVSLDHGKLAKMQEAEAPKQGCPCPPPGLRDKRGREWNLGNQGRVHQLLSAYSMVKIERLYATVFENILGEKVTTKPVVTIGRGGWGQARDGAPAPVCLHCESIEEK